MPVMKHQHGMLPNIKAKCAQEPVCMPCQSLGIDIYCTMSCENFSQYCSQFWLIPLQVVDTRHTEALLKTHAVLK